MKRSKQAVAERRRQLLRVIQEEGSAQVEALAERFSLSPMTIRRDLLALEDMEKLRRYRGGAAPLPPESMSEGEQLSIYRRRIGRMAASLVEDGDSLFINGSRTALGLLDYLGGKRVAVITNNAHAAARQYAANVRLSLTGGELRGGIMVGDYVIRNLVGAAADKTFLGCAKVYDDGEFGYSIPTEIGINEMMVSRTGKELFILADHSKLASRSTYGQGNYGRCSYDRPCTLITDERADAAIVDRLRQSGISVIQVPFSDYDEG